MADVCQGCPGKAVISHAITAHRSHKEIRLRQFRGAGVRAEPLRNQRQETVNFDFAENLGESTPESPRSS
eukprot:1332076-Rhodomonas_salina.1